MKLAGILVLVACGGGKADQDREQAIKSIDRVCTCLDDACAQKARQRAEQALAALASPPDDLPALRKRIADCVAQTSTPAAKAESFCKDLASSLETLVDVPERHGTHQVSAADADRQRNQFIADCNRGAWTDDQKRCLNLATTLAAVNACGVEIH